MQNKDDFELIMAFFQTIDLLLNVSQISNDVLFQELQNQNQKYLEKIINQNEEIIKLLKEK